MPITITAQFTDWKMNPVSNGTLTLTVGGFSSATQAKLADGTPVPASVTANLDTQGGLNVSVTANDEISTAYDVVLRDSTGVELWRSVWGGSPE